MKIKVTRKEMKNRFNKIIGIGYCDLQFLLQFADPFAYSTRSEGWACDYYNINGVLISTGYAYLDNKNTKHDYEMIREYDDKARNIIYNHDLPYEEKTNQVMELLNDFVNKCIE